MIIAILAVAVAAAPVLPTLAFVSNDHSNQSAEHANHNMAVEQQAAHASVPCTDHDGCNGQCCATCAQCFTGAIQLPPGLSHTKPVQTAVVPRLHSVLLVALHNRPPQS